MVQWPVARRRILAGLERGGGGGKVEAYTLDSSKYLIQRKGKQRFSIGRKSVLS